MKWLAYYTRKSLLVCAMEETTDEKSGGERERFTQNSKGHYDLTKRCEDQKKWRDIL